ncbi:MAG: extracellular solute-binding protein [Gemmatimonadales bacterium]
MSYPRALEDRPSAAPSARRLQAVARVAAGVVALALIAGCGRDRPKPAPPRPFLVYVAASIAQPMRAALDSFATRSGSPYELEVASSLELVRRVTAMNGDPDVIALADPGLFASLLEPRVGTWHALFARNRIVLAYTTRSRGAAAITSSNWWTILERPGIEVGRADPATDPSGYRTLFVWQLAARHYGIPDLPARMLRAAPERNVRPREADQVALLQAGELDYIWTYENLARSMGLRFVRLPDEIDLGEAADSAGYAFASARVPGARVGDTIVVRGEPILFAVSVPTRATHGRAGTNFVAYLLSPTGRRILRGASLDALEQPVIVGRRAPALVVEAADARGP